MLSYLFAYTHLSRSAWQFTIRACDQRGQQLVLGGSPFAVAVTGPSKVSPMLIDNGDGTYDCEWASSVSGEYFVMIMLNGRHVDGSPYSARVVEPTVEAERCRILAPNTIRTTAGAKAGFMIQVCLSCQ